VGSGVTDDPVVPITQNGIASFVSAVPPTISLVTAAPDVLWPPNHKMVSVAVGVVVSSAASCRIAGVSSHEAAIVPGEADWVIRAPLRVDLRAERNAGSTDRVYSVMVTCTNISNLTSSRIVTVKVPHDRGK
jgi:hypothetical protein